MRLFDLANAVDCRIINARNVEITGLSYDSRTTVPGDIFFCINGFDKDGHTFAGHAVERGAAALMVTRELPFDIPQLLVEEDRRCMALLSAEFCDHPSKKVKMIGVTGTNGKTTVTYLLKAIGEAAGLKVGLIGTIVNKIGDEDVPTERTTPESPELQKLLRCMAECDCDWVVMEVSSHSLDLLRVEGIEFDVGIFTNLTQDHLDYHKTVEKYRDAKKKLFLTSRTAVINADDPQGAFMAQDTAARVLYFGKGRGDISANEIALHPRGTDFNISFRDDTRHIALGIPGYFSVENALAAAGAAYALGVSPDVIVRGLCGAAGVPGRFEVLTKDEPFTVILDYSHTPDSLKNAIQTINGFKKGRCICLFGCGGDRDAGKRPIMGEIATSLADISVITSDNPRTERPGDIIAQIVAGAKRGGGEYVVIEDRREAMEYAITQVRPGDVVLLAGKGHETYQEIDHVKHHFDEKEIVAEILSVMK